MAKFRATYLIYKEKTNRMSKLLKYINKFVCQQDPILHADDFSSLIENRVKVGLDAIAEWFLAKIVNRWLDALLKRVFRQPKYVVRHWYVGIWIGCNLRDELTKCDVGYISRRDYVIVTSDISDLIDVYVDNGGFAGLQLSEFIARARDE